MPRFSALTLSVFLCATAFGLSLVPPATAQTTIPRSELRYILSAGIASDYVVNGVSASGGNPTFQPFFELDWRGFYGGVAISYVKVNRDRTEFDLYLGHRRQLANDIYFDVSYRHYFLNATGNCCGDARARVIFPVGESIGAEVLLAFNDISNSFNRRGRLLWQVSDQVILSGALGETSNNDNQYWNLGATYKFRDRLALNLRYEGAETGDAGLVATFGWSTASSDFVRLFIDPFQ